MAPAARAQGRRTRCAGGILRGARGILLARCVGERGRATLWGARSVAVPRWVSYRLQRRGDGRRVRLGIRDVWVSAHPRTVEHERKGEGDDALVHAFFAALDLEAVEVDGAVGVYAV